MNPCGVWLGSGGVEGLFRHWSVKVAWVQLVEDFVGLGHVLWIWCFGFGIVMCCWIFLWTRVGWCFEIWHWHNVKNSARTNTSKQRVKIAACNVRGEMWPNWMPWKPSSYFFMALNSVTFLLSCSKQLFFFADGHVIGVSVCTVIVFSICGSCPKCIDPPCSWFVSKVRAFRIHCRLWFSSLIYLKVFKITC